MAELQTRLSLEEQREEEKGKEAFILKQKLTEVETARDSLRKEVCMKIGRFLQLTATLTFQRFHFLNSVTGCYDSEASDGV